MQKIIDELRTHETTIKKELDEVIAKLQHWWKNSAKYASQLTRLEERLVNKQGFRKKP